MTRNKILALAIAIAAMAFMGAAGCKDVCHKAADHMKGCMEDWCGEHEGNPMCAAMAEAGDEVPECTEENAAQAEEVLNQSCDDITAQLDAAAALMEGLENLGNEAGGEEGAEGGE